MEKHKRFLFLILAVTTLVTAMIATASASNYTDREIVSFHIPYYRYSTPLDPRDKEDSSPVYLYITDLSYSNYNILVQALGCTSKTGSYSFENLTVSNGAMAQYVACREGVQYSIHSDIYEEGYAYASLRFQDRGESSGNTITGLWSPDSIGTYTSATGQAL